MWIERFHLVNQACSEIKIYMLEFKSNNILLWGESQIIFNYKNNIFPNVVIRWILTKSLTIFIIKFQKSQILITILINNSRQLFNTILSHLCKKIMFVHMPTHVIFPFSKHHMSFQISHIINLYIIFFLIKILYFFHRCIWKHINYTLFFFISVPSH